jgi:hypothetical protein
MGVHHETLNEKVLAAVKMKAGRGGVLAGDG